MDSTCGLICTHFVENSLRNPSFALLFLIKVEYHGNWLSTMSKTSYNEQYLEEGSGGGVKVEVSVQQM